LLWFFPHFISLVCVFSGIGYGVYSAKFLKNRIGGPELVTLTNSDLKSLGVTALGHQKAILSKVQTLQSDAAAYANAAIASSTASRLGFAENQKRMSVIEGLFFHFQNRRETCRVLMTTVSRSRAGIEEKFGESFWSWF
jgi:hypothetical protein